MSIGGWAAIAVGVVVAILFANGYVSGGGEQCLLHCLITLAVGVAGGTGVSPVAATHGSSLGGRSLSGDFAGSQNGFVL